MKAGLAIKGLDPKGGTGRTPRMAVDLEEVVKRLGVGPEWVESWVREGVLPAPNGTVHPWELEKFRVTQQARIAEAQAKPEPQQSPRHIGPWQRFLDWFGWRSAIEHLEAENCRLMLQTLQLEHELELLSGRHTRLQASAEELREELDRSLRENVALKAQKPPSSGKKGRRR
jgi:hypothetical protein